MSLLLSHKNLLLSLSWHMSLQLLTPLPYLKAWEMHTDVIQTFTPPFFCTTRMPLERLLICLKETGKVDAHVFIPQTNSIGIRPFLTIHSKLVWLQECKMEQKADFQDNVSCEEIWLHVGVVEEWDGKRIRLTFWSLVLCYLPCLGLLWAFLTAQN